jgi:hypothetical protein
MMYRSKWATRSNQQRIVAIWLRRSAFDGYLARAVHESVEPPDSDHARLKGRVRLQWDPDHLPDGTPAYGRRAIQLGLRQIESFIDGRDILRIVDITPFVQTQYNSAVCPKGRRRDRQDQLDQLRIPIQHIYEPDDEQIRRHIHLDASNVTEARLL